MTPTEPEKPKWVYRVRSVHKAPSYGEPTTKTYVRTRHFFSRDAAFRSYNHLRKSLEQSVPHHWGAVLRVEISRSLPLSFDPEFTLSTDDDKPVYFALSS